MSDRSVELWVKREDLVHQDLGGNKWRKLKYNLLEAVSSGASYMGTFGGAYSNHIYAVAAAGALLQIPTVGIIRGEELYPLNPTLSFAQSRGMTLSYISRERYRQKNTPVFQEYLHQHFPPSGYWVPEGGTNERAITGVEEMAQEIMAQLEIAALPNVVAVASGTGGTAAGLIRGLSPAGVRVLAFSALKGNFLKREIDSWLPDSQTARSWGLVTSYHFGGYARHSKELLRFIEDFFDRFGIPLEPVYTGKMFFGLVEMIKERYFEPGTRILAIHTGGLQGLQGFEERFGNLLKRS